LNAENADTNVHKYTRVYSQVLIQLSELEEHIVEDELAQGSTSTTVYSQVLTDIAE